MEAPAGDPYDFEYPNEFLKNFAQSLAPAQFKNVTSATQKQPDNVMDFTLLFEPK